MKSKKARYQQGSIRKVERAKGFVWEVRFSGRKGGKRYQRTEIYDPAQYRTEKDVRKAIELTISQVNAGTAGEKADAKFGAVTHLYRTEHLPTLAHSTRQVNSYLLTKYIEDRFGHTPVRDIKPLVINEWIQALELSQTTKASIRSIMSVCFRLAALHEFIPPMAANPMSLIKLKGVTKRQKKIPEISVADFRKLYTKLPEPLNIMVLLGGAYGLRISEILGLKWEDIDEKANTIAIMRKFTRGQIGETKTASSEAPLPLAKSLLAALLAYKPMTDNSEWVFPSPQTGGPRSASMLLQKGLKPIAKELGLGNVGFHSLRHACRSWLSSGGAAVGTQKDLLRHSDIATTMNVYGHSLTPDMRKAHDKLVKKLLS
ncbi:MAG: site-specific integrase [Terracidiphilus sp.]